MRRRMVLLLALVAVPALAGEPEGLAPAQLQALREGRGMGLSLPAELNGHPGPVHVLENAEALALTPPQAAAMAGLVERMKGEAVALGERIIAREAELDALFAAGRPDDARLASLVEDIALLTGRLRLVHLRTHADTAVLMTPEQVAKYNAIRRPGHAGHG